MIRIIIIIITIIIVIIIIIVLIICIINSLRSEEMFRTLDVTNDALVSR